MARESYARPALIPASPWLSHDLPGKPVLVAVQKNGFLNVAWSPSRPEKVQSWVLQRREGDKWITDILSGSITSKGLKTEPRCISIRAVDRYGNMSSATALERLSSAAN